MTEGVRYALWALGGVLVALAAFLWIWEKEDRPGHGTAQRTLAWAILAAGAACLAAGWLVPVEPSPPVPPFLLGK
ncbi:MAG: hypothetical protein D6708_04100 [Candidatus Dadabacteria bacterium]|nr:MAG: hypothetical protein D6708_04100 [Candidatus Dadabacteria bacterium]